MTLSTRAKEAFRGLLRWLYLTRGGGEAAGCAAGGGPPSAGRLGKNSAQWSKRWLQVKCGKQPPHSSPSGGGRSDRSGRPKQGTSVRNSQWQ
jgi:hypothetical protein